MAIGLLTSRDLLGLVCQWYGYTFHQHQMLLGELNETQNATSPIKLPHNCLPDSPVASVRINNPNLHPIGEPESEPRPKGGPRRRRPEFPIPTQLPTTNSLNSADVSPQDFWKFHLLKFGPDMYLTTNPTPRHLYCRSFPGFYIGVDGNSADCMLSFEDIETGKTYLKIRKQKTKQGETFRYKLRRVRSIENGQVKEFGDEGDETGHEIETRNETEIENYHKSSELPVYEGILRREQIPPVLLPTYPDCPMASYQTTDVNGKKWSVGSIPRVRESRVNNEELKLVAKQNIYFHTVFDEQLSQPLFRAPTVSAVFRPSEVSKRKRMMRSINRLLKIDSELKIKSDVLDTNVHSGVRYYYKASDGLYGESHPQDDDPDKHSKYGWLTIFENPELFSQPGMFDLVIGLVVAVSYEKLIL